MPSVRVPPQAWKPSNRHSDSTRSKVTEVERTAGRETSSTGAGNLRDTRSRELRNCRGRKHHTRSGRAIQSGEWQRTKHGARLGSLMKALAGGCQVAEVRNWPASTSTSRTNVPLSAWHCMALDRDTFSALVWCASLRSFSMSGSPDDETWKRSGERR
jgi:hypothetical protein